MGYFPTALSQLSEGFLFISWTFYIWTPSGTSISLIRNCTGLHKQTVNSAQTEGIGRALHQHVLGLEWQGQDPSVPGMGRIISLACSLWSQVCLCISCQWDVAFRLHLKRPVGKYHLYIMYYSNIIYSPQTWSSKRKLFCCYSMVDVNSIWYCCVWWCIPVAANSLYITHINVLLIYSCTTWQSTNNILLPAPHYWFSQWSRC